MRLIIYISFTLFHLSTLSQITQNRIIKNDSLKYKSIQLLFPTQNPYVKYTASAFFIKYKKKYFLVTNYHVITGRIWEDTSKFATTYAPYELNDMTATIYSNNKDGYENIEFHLHDSNGIRKYLSLPIDTSTRRVSVDIAFMKIDSLPGQTMIAPINLSKAKKWIKITPNTKLFSYGYSKRTWQDLYPFCDTITTVGDSTFLYKDRYITVYNPPAMHGSSGSPVYCQNNGNYFFVGVFFAVVPPELKESYDELFPRTYYTNPIGFVLTANYLKKSLDFLLSSNR